MNLLQHGKQETHWAFQKGLWEGIYKMWRLESLSSNVDRDWSEFVNQVAGRVSDWILGTYKFLLD